MALEIVQLCLLSVTDMWRQAHVWLGSSQAPPTKQNSVVYVLNKRIPVHVAFRKKSNSIFCFLFASAYCHFLMFSKVLSYLLHKDSNS